MMTIHRTVIPIRDQSRDFELVIEVSHRSGDGLWFGIMKGDKSYAQGHFTPEDAKVIAEAITSITKFQPHTDNTAVRRIDIGDTVRVSRPLVPDAYEHILDWFAEHLPEGEVTEVWSDDEIVVEFPSDIEIMATGGFVRNQIVVKLEYAELVKAADALTTEEFAALQDLAKEVSGG